MNLIFSLLEWLVIWGVSWFLWIYLLKRGINYVDSFRFTIFYFCSFSILAWIVFNNYLQAFFFRMPIKLLPFIGLILFFVVTTIVYTHAKRILSKELISSHKKSLIFFATMDYLFLFSKSFDIFFQQLLFLTLVLIFRVSFGNSANIVLFCAVLFGAIHLPLFITKHNILAPYFVIASFFAGGIFSWLILSFPYGFIYSYIFHWMFYVVAGVVFNRKVLLKFIYM